MFCGVETLHTTKQTQPLLFGAASLSSGDVLPSLLSLVHLCSATAGSRCHSGPAPAGWPVPSPHPAGPGTGKGSSLPLPAPQTADKAPLGRSTASWLHIC